MCELGSVQFDKMVVNTDLAHKYFKEKNNTFQSISELSKDILREDEKQCDGFNTIVFSTFRDGVNINDHIDATYKRLSDEEIEDIREKQLKLAKLVEANAELFGQIEYLIRKIPVNEVKESDIKLIVQNLTCRSFMPKRYLMFESEYRNVDIRMDSDTPLANIGFVAQLLINHNRVQIFPTKKTAAVSCLFVELCKKVGLDTVEVIIIKQDLLETSNWLLVNMSTVPSVMKGCVGVITEHSDLDSAVDVFLGTTIMYPWKLTRILVQESIYDRFKKAIAWKSGLESKNTGVTDTLKRYSDNVYTCDGKTFLINYAGPPESVDTDKVLVEAYRTSKELIAMITKYESLYLSLWSSDLSEANEIAYYVPSSIVWINGYGIFDGPPKTSQTIYRELFYNDKCTYKFQVDKDLLAQQVKWSKRTFDERRRFIYIAAAEFLKDKKNNSHSEDVKKLMKAVSESDTENFVSVENGRMITGISVPTGDIFIIGVEEKDPVFLAKLLTSGSAILIQDDISDSEHFAHKLSPAIPIAFTIPKGDGVSVGEPVFRTKVVWSNFGTTFAN